jgi:hypothetical protein
LEQSGKLLVLYSREKLVEERGFVGGATRDIEIGRVGRRQGAQVLRDQGERTVPVDWNVVVGGGVIHHRVRHTPLYLQIKVVPVVEFGYRRAAKNSGGQRFEVASQATALAPFSQNSNDEVCLGSGHAHPGQSKSSGWFHAQQRCTAADRDTLLGQSLAGCAQRAPSACGLAILLDRFFLGPVGHPLTDSGGR